MPSVELARAVSERGEVILRRRTDGHRGAPAELELRVNGVYVMGTEHTSSEVLLARTGLALVGEPSTVLVGGLGLGFTVREVLADDRVRHLTVAEIEPALVAWFRDGTVPDGPALLADPRLSVSIVDVRDAVAQAPPASVDLVLLDVDNGPDFLVYPQNATLYASGFLRRVHRALRPGGAIGVWSATESPSLADALRDVFGATRSHACLALLQGREHTYWLHSARRRPT